MQEALKQGELDAVYEMATRITAERDALLTERAAIIERLDGLSEGESLLAAISFIVVEWEHFGRELRRAVNETIPKLTAERDEALAEAARLRAALEEICRLSGSKTSDLVVACTVGHIALRALALGDGQGDAEG